MKIFKIISAILLSFVVTTACGEKTESVVAQYPEPSVLAEKILAEAEFNSPVYKTAKDLPDYIDGFDISGVKNAAYVINGSGAYADEILIAQFDGAGTVAANKDAIARHIEKSKKSWENYVPEEALKFDTAYVANDGEWLFYTVLSDNDKAKKIIADNK
jgi:hypothetical protein